MRCVARAGAKGFHDSSSKGVPVTLPLCSTGGHQKNQENKKPVRRPLAFPHSVDSKGKEYTGGRRELKQACLCDYLHETRTSFNRSYYKPLSIHFFISSSLLSVSLRTAAQKRPPTQPGPSFATMCR